MNTPPIFADVQDHLNEYMAFPDAETTGDQSLAVTLWIFHTRTFSPSFPRTPWATPYLYVGSPEKQCGKSLLIELIEPLVVNPAKMIGMTSSVLFRLIEQRQPILFIDEADTIWQGAGQGDKEMRGVLNGGYKHGGYIWRNEMTADGPEPRQFSTFCPKLIAGIDNGNLPETIQDRAIPIRLRRKRDDEQRSTYYAYKAEPVAEALQARITQWVRENAEAIADYEPEPTPGISNRAWEISMPLIQIAHAAGMEPQARETLARLLTPGEEKDSPGVRVLREILTLFDQAEEDRLHTQTIIEHLNKEVGGGWNGKALVSRVLKPYSIESAELMTIGPRTGRGYYRFQFEDAFKRYL